MARMTWFFYAMVTMAVLTVTFFIYGTVIVPVWNWASEITGAVSRTTSSWFATKPTSTNPAVKNSSPNLPPTPIYVTTEKAAKPANCDKIIRQIKSGKYVGLPPECEQTYQLANQREQDAQNEKNRQYESAQREINRQQAEREGQAQRDAEQQRALERQQEADRMRAANLEKERLRNEDENRRRQEARADADRQQARRDADERERTRQRETQKRNEAIIKFGSDLRRVFKKN